jgi:hypothetical protein
MVRAYRQAEDARPGLKEPRGLRGGTYGAASPVRRVPVTPEAERAALQALARATSPDPADSG